jgi:hypothetical protein
MGMGYMMWLGPNRVVILDVAMYKWGYDTKFA